MPLQPLTSTVYRFIPTEIEAYYLTVWFFFFSCVRVAYRGCKGVILHLISVRVNM
jgi:hypothetical protein